MQHQAQSMDSQSETLICWDSLFERMNKFKPTDTSSDKRIKTSMAPASSLVTMSSCYVPRNAGWPGGGLGPPPVL